jgi:hypothetical protein
MGAQHDARDRFVQTDSLPESGGVPRSAEGESSALLIDGMPDAFVSASLLQGGDACRLADSTRRQPLSEFPPMHLYPRLLALACLALVGAPLVESCSTTQPAGEQFLDAGITTKIKAKFTAAADINPFNISVETEEGTVYLTGRVHKQEQKDEAERIARETDGVRRVVNHIEVGDRT